MLFVNHAEFRIDWLDAKGRQGFDDTPLERRVSPPRTTEGLPYSSAGYAQVLG